MLQQKEDPKTKNLYWEVSLSMIISVAPSSAVFTEADIVVNLLDLIR